MRESYEDQKCIFIIMDQATGGELLEHINMYELEEKEIVLIMYQIT